MRQGALFIDLNCTGRVIHDAEILQLSAVKKTNTAGYDAYAKPSGWVMKYIWLFLNILAIID